MLEVKLGAGGNKLAAPAVVRYRRGFHHGLEFTAITPDQLEVIRRACDGALPFFDLRDRPSNAARKGANQARR